MLVKVAAYFWVTILSVSVYDFTCAVIHELAVAEAYEICHGYQD